MKIGITTFGCDGGRSGIGRYAIRLIDEIAALATGHEVEVLVHPGEAAVFVPDRPNVRALECPEVPRSPLANIGWHLFGLPALARRRGYDVLFLPAGNRRLPWSAPCPTVGTVHDFSILHVPAKYGRVRETYLTRVLPRLVARLSRVVTVSQSSLRDIASLTGVPGEQIRVIPNGADLDQFRAGDPGASRGVVRERLGLDGPYFLYVSRIEHPGKNHMRLIEAYDRFRMTGAGRQRLVLAGPDWDRADEVHARAARSPYAADIVFTGFVDDEDLPHLYAAADGVVFPSLYEGFGIPVLEAMASGCPVACSSTSSLPEVGGDAALYFSPESVEEIARAMSVLATRDAETREQIARGLGRASGFSWTKTAERTLATLEEAAGEPSFYAPRALHLTPSR